MCVIHVRIKLLNKKNNLIMELVTWYKSVVLNNPIKVVWYGIGFIIGVSHKRYSPENLPFFR